MDDEHAYLKYPHHRHWFNKLYVATLFGYDCGPCGTAPTKDGTYVVRPIYNLSGMSVGATVKDIKAGNNREVPAGYFWCEYLTGNHYSANYVWKYDRDMITGKWLQPWKGSSCWEGTNMPINLTKFVEWKRSDYIPEVPDELASLRDVGVINVEFKGDQVIEVHLRPSADPDYDHLIPVWASDLGIKKQHMETHGFDFVDSYDDADGQLEDPRIGFLVK
jgi:hypothetical protein